MASEFRYSDKNPSHPVAYACFHAMHTRMEAVLADVDETAARRLTEEIGAEVKALERLFNRFDDASPLAVINARAAREAVDAGDELFMALELCEAFRKGTGGYFDITTSTGSGGKTSGYALDPSAHTVRFTREGIMLDMGGFAKGYALERVRRRVADAGITCGVLNFGNSSIAALGHHPYGEWWPIGVEHTKMRSVMAHEFHLCDRALSISGRSPEGEYHIVNPLTGATVAGEELIAVEGRSALVAEVLSTALYAAPKALRAAIVGQYEGYAATELYCREGGSCEIRRINCD